MATTNGFLKKCFSIALTPLIVATPLLTGCSSVSATGRTSSGVDNILFFDDSESSGHASNHGAQDFQDYVSFATDYKKETFRKGDSILAVRFDARSIQEFTEITSKYATSSEIENIIKGTLSIKKSNRGTPLGSAVRFATRYIKSSNGKAKRLIFLTDAEDEPLEKGHSDPKLENLTKEIIDEFVAAIKKNAPDTVVVFPFLALSKRMAVQERFAGVKHLIIGTKENISSDSTRATIKAIKNALKD